MTPYQIERIRHFLTDEIMSGAVREVLFETFLEPETSKDTNYLAASRIAIDLLKRAWGRLEELRNEAQEPGRKTNPGL